MSNVYIKSKENDEYMVAEDGLVNDSLVYCKPGSPIEFTRTDTPDGTTFLATGTNLYLSYRVTGAVKLYDSPLFYLVEDSGAGDDSVTIYSQPAEQYMWLYGNEGEPYVTGEGKPQNVSSHWLIVPVQ